MKINIKELLSVMLTGAVLVNPVVENNNAYSVTNISDYVELVEEPKYVDDLMNVLKNYPQGLLQLLIDDGCKFTFIGRERWLEDVILRKYLPMFDGYARGYYNPESKHIYIESFPRTETTMAKVKKSIYSKNYTDEELNSLIATSTLIHELGHAVDYYFNNISQSSSFKEVYKSEKSNFENTIEFDLLNYRIKANIANPDEYFAESSAAFFFYPEDLQINCPETYEYLSSIYDIYKYSEVEIEEPKVKTK